MLRLIEREEIDPAYRVVFVGTVGDGSLPVRLLQSAIGCVRAMAAIVGHRDAVVHVHLSQKGSFARKAPLIRFASALGRPLVVHVHGSEFDSWAASGGRTTVRRVRRALRSADVVVALSDDWRRRLQDLAPDARLEVVRNAVSAPEYKHEGVGDGVVFVGRLERRKGVYVLLEAIRMLQAEGVEEEFVLAGDGDVAEVSSLVRGLPRPELVRVPGWLETDLLRPIVASARVFVLPSFEEGLPMALLEAMSMGRACVVTPAGGMSEVVEDGVNGRLVPAGDAGSLAGAIGGLLEDPTLAQQLGLAAHETVQARYSAGDFIERLHGIYVDVLERRRAAS